MIKTEIIWLSIMIQRSLNNLKEKILKRCSFYGKLEKIKIYEKQPCTKFKKNHVQQIASLAMIIKVQ